MRRMTGARRHSGGAILWVIAAVLLAAAAYFGYRGVVFYRQHVAPAVAEVS